MEFWQLSSAFAVSALRKFSLISDWKVPCFKSSSGLVLSMDGERWMSCFFPLPFLSVCLKIVTMPPSSLDWASPVLSTPPCQLSPIDFQSLLSVSLGLSPVAHTVWKISIPNWTTNSCLAWNSTKTREGNLDHLHMTSFLCSDPGCPWHDREPLLGQVGWSAVVAVWATCGGLLVTTQGH